MKSGWRRFWDFALIAYFSVQIITSWRTEDQVWLAAQIGIMISLMIGAILGIQWPESATQPKAAKVTLWASIVVGIVSMSVSSVVLSRHHPNAVVPTALHITPAQATQGQALEVTINTTSFRFTDRSIPHFGPGITVLDSHNTSETALAAHIEIAAGTATGFRRIWVSTPGAQTAIDDSLQGAFSVFAGTPAEK